MKLYGLLVVQNEADVIEDLLFFLRKLNIYETIFFFDLGSEDDTFAKAQQFRDILHKPQVLKDVYSGKLRYELLLQHQNLYKDGDWVALVDADEFYFDNPMEFIRLAESENATCIKTYQVQFMFTERDLKNFEKENLSTPVYDRRKHYLIHWSEERFFKYLPAKGFIDRSRPCSRRFLNRHYQYRTPQQIERRIETRLRNKKLARGLVGRSEWTQVFSAKWTDYVVSHEILHEHKNGEFRFGLPRIVRFKEYYSKEDYSYLAPQIAEALLTEREHSDKMQPSQKPTVRYGTHDPGTVNFENHFGRRVQQEIKEDVLALEWRRVIGGILVLLSYGIRLIRLSGIQKLNVAFCQLRNAGWNLGVTAKRFLSGKSMGYINADPNPIPVSDFTGVGVTCLKWSSRRTKTVEIRIQYPDGQILNRSGPSAQMHTGKWVSDDMVFFLQDVSAGLPLSKENTLAKVSVKITKTNRTII